MEYSDIVKLLSDPNHVAEGLAELDAYNKDVTTKLGTLTDQHAKDDETIKSLRDSNMKLYLRTTGKPDNEEPEDERTDYEKLIDKIKEKGQ